VSEISVVVAGAAGRMGRTILRSVHEAPDMEVCGAVEAAGHPDLGQDAGTLAGLNALGVALTHDALPVVAHALAIIDFTRPKVSVELAGLAAQARIVHVIGTTGFSTDEEAAIRAAARHAVIIKSGNMSMGVTLLANLVARAAKALPHFDIEVVEMHHRLKVDAPSGTALLLGEAAAEARGISLPKNAVRAREGITGERQPGTIGFASVRGGTMVGEHQVILAGPYERIVLGHIAEDRAIFANGAIAAARWGQGRKPGLYNMGDVLGIE
jgi:4-hydroxy-tetrahydrodipicolinate reductase